MFLDYLDRINSDPALIYALARTLVIYIYAIFLIRIGNKRYNFGTPFDLILLVIIGSVLSRTINGDVKLYPAIIASLLLTCLHWLFALGAFYSHSIGRIIKGESCILIRDGKLNWDNLKRNQISQADLRESCREQMHHDNLGSVKEARIERSGRITFIER